MKWITLCKSRLCPAEGDVKLQIASWFSYLLLFTSLLRNQRRLGLEKGQLLAFEQMNLWSEWLSPTVQLWNRWAEQPATTARAWFSVKYLSFKPKNQGNILIVTRFSFFSHKPDVFIEWKMVWGLELCTIRSTKSRKLVKKAMFKFLRTKTVFNS